MPKISQHSHDITVVAVRGDHTSGISVLKVYRPWSWQCVITLLMDPTLPPQEGQILQKEKYNKKRIKEIFIQLLSYS